MKIVHVITRLIKGGADENTLLTCNWFAAKGHQVTLIYGNDVDPDFVFKLDRQVRRIQVTDLRREISFAHDLKALIQLRRLYRDIRPDVVHTHTSKAGVLGRAAALGVKIPAIVHSIHILPFVSERAIKRHFFVSIERMVAPFTDSFISVSEGMRRTALAHRIGPEDRHFVAPSGMAVDAFVAARVPVRSRDARPLRVVYLANYEPRKQHLPLLAVIAGRRADFEGLVHFTFAGRGFLEPDIREFVAANGLGDLIDVRGFVDDAPELIGRSDLGIYCSTNEGLPRAVVQYCAAGKPILAMTLPGLDAVVKHDGNGYLVPNGDFEALGSAILRIASDDGERMRLAAASESVDVSTWSVETMCRMIDSVYAKGLGRRWTAPKARPTEQGLDVT